MGTSRGLKVCCAVTAIFIVMIAIIFTILAFTVFKPKDPEITIYPQGLENIGFGLGGISNLSTANLNVSVAMIVAINNRNYGSFKFKNATAFVNYRGDVVGTVPIEQARVPAHGKLNISTVAAFMMDRLTANASFWEDVLAGSVNLSTDATMHGKVTMFKVFKIQASVPSRCDISLFIQSQRVESICKTKIKL